MQAHSCNPESIQCGDDEHSRSEESLIKAGSRGCSWNQRIVHRKSVWASQGLSWNSYLLA